MTTRPAPPKTLISAAIAAGAILALGLASAETARADTCAGAAVSARGENSRFEWTAKSKAKANWRRRVRGTPGLGAAYSDWARAADTEIKCLSGPAGSVCTLSGRPCRK